MWEEPVPRMETVTQYILEALGEVRNPIDLCQRKPPSVLRGARSEPLTKGCIFKLGDWVLLLPSAKVKLLTKWQGPYEIVYQVGPADY